MLLIKGTIVFDDYVELARGVKVYIRLEDVSRTDIAARVVTEKVIHNKSVRGKLLKFTIKGDRLDPRAHYGIRAHIDLDNDGQISKGDYVSVVSYPIDAKQLPAMVSIAVRLVH